MERAAARLVGATIATPVGPVLAISSDIGLCALPFLEGFSLSPTPPARTDGDAPPQSALSAPQDDPRSDASGSARRRGRHRLDARLQRWFKTVEIVDDPCDATLARTREWLDAYFEGTPTQAAAPPLDLRGAAFEVNVWSALLDIPIGATTSYGAIARVLGSPNAARAVGLANGANPIPIIVPCHRVIGASGTLTGYGGGLERKAWLLAHEEKYWGRTPRLAF
jgi:methylated-DNA-[protein]-cysteine S-methyltransferase